IKINEMARRNHENYLRMARNVRNLAEEYYEEGNQSKCWHAVWRNHVYKTYPMCYNTFLRYMHAAREQRVKSSPQRCLFD
ncbi:MAG: hypothetical protein ACRCZB_03545, partial [Bacteroidales bacterium]